MTKEVKVLDKTFEIFINANEIDGIVKNLVVEVSRDIGDCNPVFVGVLNGAFLFMSDFVRNYPYPCEISFVKMASYEGMQTTGTVKTLLGANENYEGRTIVLLEDIVDTGNTIEELYKIFKGKDVKEFRVATLFMKPEAYKKSFPIHHIGKKIEDRFIVGYGLDYNGYGRNLPHIYQLKK